MEHINKYKYIVWVGGVDDYYTNYKDAKKDYDDWISKGYDQVSIVKINELPRGSGIDRV